MRKPPIVTATCAVCPPPDHSRVIEAGDAAAHRVHADDGARQCRPRATRRRWSARRADTGAGGRCRSVVRIRERDAHVRVGEHAAVDRVRDHVVEPAEHDERGIVRRLHRSRCRCSRGRPAVPAAAVWTRSRERRIRVQRGRVPTSMPAPEPPPARTDLASTPAGRELARRAASSARPRRNAGRHSCTSYRAPSDRRDRSARARPRRSASSRSRSARYGVRDVPRAHGRSCRPRLGGRGVRSPRTTRRCRARRATA